MNTVRKLEDRRFVIFDAAQIDVNSVVALAYQLQNLKGQDKEGKPTIIQVQVAIVMLDTGGSVTLGGDGLKKFEIWWKKNVKAEKIDLPVEAEVVPPPVAANKPAAEPVAAEPAAPPLVAAPSFSPETGAVEKAPSVAAKPEKTAPEQPVVPPELPKAPKA